MNCNHDQWTSRLHSCYTLVVSITNTTARLPCRYVSKLLSEHVQSTRLDAGLHTRYRRKTGLCLGPSRTADNILTSSAFLSSTLKEFYLFYSMSPAGVPKSLKSFFADSKRPNQPSKSFKSIVFSQHVVFDKYVKHKQHQTPKYTYQVNLSSSKIKFRSVIRENARNLLTMQVAGLLVSLNLQILNKWSIAQLFHHSSHE